MEADLRIRDRLQHLISHPATRGLDLNSPCTTLTRRRIIREKRLLREIYQRWYATIRNSVHTSVGPILELGSGPGFLQDILPNVITSEILYCDHVTIVADAMRLPFKDETLGGVVMTDVLHHLPRVREFFKEASRCVRPRGRIVMIEPWVTPWSRVVYGKLHHEPFEPAAVLWEFDSSGPLSGANSALPWILFERDRPQFEMEFPEWRVVNITLGMPLVYALSGGWGMRSLVPDWSIPLCWRIERLLHPWMRSIALFAEIVLERETGFGTGRGSDSAA